MCSGVLEKFCFTSSFFVVVFLFVTKYKNQCFRRKIGFE